MSRLTKVFLGSGMVALLLAVVVVVLGVGGAGGTATKGAIAAVGFYGALAVLYVLVSGRQQTDDGEDGVGSLTERAPERTPSQYPLAGNSQLDLAMACKSARNARDVEAGFAVVRDPLQHLLVDALVAGGEDASTARQAIREGSWTDDEVARTVLSEDISVELTLRQRLREWLFPGTLVQAWTRRTVGAVADTVDESVPPVVGQDAPRRVPVRPPTLEEQRRSAAGGVEPATDASFGYRWRRQPSDGDKHDETDTSGDETAPAGVST